MFVKFWKIPEITCAVEFNFTETGAIRLSIHAILIMSVLHKKTEFYKGESDREVIVIAAGGVGKGAPPAGRFPIMGSFLPIKCFPLLQKVLVPPIVT